MTGEIGPEYQRLISQIRSKIASGEYPVGKQIPSTTDLKAQTGMSLTVVRRAVQQLQADGILEGHPGKGVFVRALPQDADREKNTLETLGAQVSALRETVTTLAEQEAAPQSAISALREDVGRIETNLMDLYARTGHDYPEGESDDAPKATASRGRSRR